MKENEFQPISDGVAERDPPKSDAQLLTECARRLYALAAGALDCADQNKDEYCLLLSNLADDLACFISGIELQLEATL